MRMKKQTYIPYVEHEKIRVAVMFQVASYWPSIESFYEACRMDDAVDIRIYYVDDLAVEKAQMEHSEAFLRERRLPYEIYSEDRIDAFLPHVALYQPPHDVLYRNPPALSIHLKRKGIRILYIPYGIEIADTADARLAHFYTYVVRNSWRIYTFSKIMQEDYQMYCPNRHAVRATGSPKFDAVCGGDFQRSEEVSKKADGRKVIVWKMHFPKLIYEGIRQLQVTPYLSEYIRFAEQLQQYQDLLFVILPHPIFFSGVMPQQFARDVNRLFETLKRQENAVLDRSDDYRNSLYTADAIMVDRSALMVEAGLCDVPVLYMRNQDYEEPLTNAVKSLVDSYEQGTSAEDMASFVERFRSNATGDFRTKRAAVLEASMPFLDGACGKRILADMKEGIQNETDGRMRVVFFGAGIVCEHYIRELGILQNPDYLVLGLSDNNPKKWGTMHAGMRIMPPEQLKELAFDLLVITTEQNHVPIKQKLVYELCLDDEKIWRLDVFCEHYFAKDGMEQGWF